MKGYPGSLVKMNKVMEVARNWKGNRREKKEASSWRGESYSEGRQSFAYPLSPPCLLLKKKETLTVTHIFEKAQFYN